MSKHECQDLSILHYRDKGELIAGLLISGGFWMFVASCLGLVESTMKSPEFSKAQKVSPARKKLPCKMSSMPKQQDSAATS